MVVAASWAGAYGTVTTSWTCTRPVMGRALGVGAVGAKARSRHVTPAAMRGAIRSPWRARSRIGLPPVEPSHVLGDDGWSGLAVGGGAVGIGRCVVALDGEGARLAAVRVNDGRLGGGRVHRCLLC